MQILYLRIRPAGRGTTYHEWLKLECTLSLFHRCNSKNDVCSGHTNLVNNMMHVAAAAGWQQQRGGSSSGVAAAAGWQQQRGGISSGVAAAAMHCSIS